MHVDNELLFAGSYNGLVILEIVFDFKPSYGTTYDDINTTNYVEIVDNLAYVSGGWDGIRVISRSARLSSPA